jgi:hypothetical protein
MEVSFQGQSMTIREWIHDIYERVAIKIGATDLNLELLDFYQEEKRTNQMVNEFMNQSDFLYTDEWKTCSDEGLDLAKEFIAFIRKEYEYDEALKFYYNMEEDEYEEAMYKKIQAIVKDPIMKPLSQLSDLVRYHNLD